MAKYIMLFWLISISISKSNESNPKEKIILKNRFTLDVGSSSLLEKTSKFAKTFTPEIGFSFTSYFKKNTGFLLTFSHFTNGYQINENSLGVGLSIRKLISAEDNIFSLDVALSLNNINEEDYDIGFLFKLNYEKNIYKSIFFSLKGGMVIVQDSPKSAPFSDVYNETRFTIQGGIHFYF